MNPEIVRVREDGDLVTLRATRRFLEDLVVFLKDVPAIGEEFWGSRAHYLRCRDLLADMEALLAGEEGEIIEFQRDKTYFFYELSDALHIDLSGISDAIFPTVNTLPQDRVMVIKDLLLYAQYRLPQREDES